MSNFYTSWIPTSYILMADWDNFWSNSNHFYCHSVDSLPVEINLDSIPIQAIDDLSLASSPSPSPSDFVVSWPSQDENSEILNQNQSNNISTNSCKSNISNKIASSFHSGTSVTVDRPYSCSYCQRNFSRRHDLERHTRVHTGIKPYKCPACNKSFARSDARRRHWKSEAQCNTNHTIIALLKRRGRRSD